MATAFNLTAQINLRGPGNLKPVISKIRKELSSVTANVTVKIDPKASKSVDVITKKIDIMNKALTTSQGNVTRLNAALTQLSSTFNVLNSTSNKVSASISSVANNSKSVSSNVKEATNILEDFGKQGALAVKRFTAFTVATGAVFGLVNAVRQGFKEFVNFDKQVVRLQQVTGLSAVGLKSLTSEITNLSKSLGVASSDLAQVATTLSQAGLSADQTRIALKALAQSELAPSFENLTKTTEGAIAAMRQFSIDARDLGDVLGSVNAVASKFAVESGDIISAIQRTGGVFASASKGVSQGKQALNEFIAVFTSVRATTRESAETIATGLRTIFTRIQRSSTLELLKQFGIELQDLEGKFVGPFAAVQRLSEGLSGLDPRDIRFSRIVEELGGFRQIGKVIPLLQQFKTAQDALAAAQGGQKSLYKDQIIAQQSLANQIARVREQFLALIRDIGQSNAFNFIFKGVVSLTGGIVKLADSLKGLLPIIAVIGTIKGIGALSQVAKGFGKTLGILPSQGGGQQTSFLNPAAAEEQKTSAAMDMASKAIQDNTNAIKTLTSGITALTNKLTSLGGFLGFNTGGVVPGSGNRDSVPAMLTPGEVVINKRAAQKYGRGNLVRLNKYGAGGRSEFSHLDIGQDVELKKGEVKFSGKTLSNFGIMLPSSINQRLSRKEAVTAQEMLTAISNQTAQELFSGQLSPKRGGYGSFKRGKKSEAYQSLVQKAETLRSALIAKAETIRGPYIGNESLEPLREIIEQKASPELLEGFKQVREIIIPKNQQNIEAITKQSRAKGKNRTGQEAFGNRGQLIERVTKKSELTYKKIGGLIQKFVNGGTPQAPILQTNTVGAAIFDDYGSTSFSVSSDEIIKYALRDRKNEQQKEADQKYLEEALSNRSYIVKRQGLSGEISSIIDDELGPASVGMMNSVSERLNRKINPNLAGGPTSGSKDKASPILRGSDAENFGLSYRQKFRPIIFEQLMDNIKRQGSYPNVISTAEQNEFFDFTTGLGATGDLFPELKDLLFVDAKTSADAARNESMSKKIANTILQLRSEGISSSQAALIQPSAESSELGSFKTNLLLKLGKRGQQSNIPLPSVSLSDSRLASLQQSLVEAYTESIGTQPTDDDILKYFKQKRKESTVNVADFIQERASGGLIQKFADGGGPAKEHRKISLLTGNRIQASYLGKWGLDKESGKETLLKDDKLQGHVVADKIGSNLYSVQSSSATKGYGPRLYDVVMEAATEAGSMLTSDRKSVSESAKKVWDFYFSKRSDVNKTPLDPIDWTSNGRLIDEKLYGKPDTWPPKTDPAWVLQTGYSKNPSLINNSDFVKRLKTGGTIRKFMAGGGVKELSRSINLPEDQDYRSLAFDTDALHDALMNYTEDSAVINLGLTGQRKVGSEQKKTIASLDQLFNFDYYPPEDLYAGFGSTRTRILTGGLDAHGVPASYTLSPSEIENKGPVSFPGYFSTSASKAVANRFKGSQGSLVHVDAKPPVIDVVKAAADLGANLPRSLHQELEYILPKNSKFAVENLEFGDNGDTKADLKQLKIGGLIQKFGRGGLSSKSITKSKKALGEAKKLLGKKYSRLGEGLISENIESRLGSSLGPDALLDEILSEYEGASLGEKAQQIRDKTISDMLTTPNKSREDAIGLSVGVPTVSPLGPNITPEVLEEAVRKGEVGKSLEREDVFFGEKLKSITKLFGVRRPKESVEKQKEIKVDSRIAGTGFEGLSPKSSLGDEDVFRRLLTMAAEAAIAERQVSGASESDRLERLAKLIEKESGDVPEIDGDEDLAARAIASLNSWNKSAKSGEWTRLGLDQASADYIVDELSDPNTRSALEAKYAQQLKYFDEDFQKALAGEPLKNAGRARAVQAVGNAVMKANYASGGLVQRFATGGTVPAMVSSGEAFVPPDVAKSIGYGKLEKMNQADRNGMTGFAGGGISVFKGPGTGTSDGIGPIGLPEGSFVIREKATKALGLSRGGSVGSIQRFVDGGTAFDVLQQDSGMTAKRFSESLQKEILALTQGLIDGLKEAKRNFVVDIGKVQASINAGGDPADIRENVIASVGGIASKAGVTDPAQIERAVNDVITGLQSGLSIDDIKNTSADLKSILDAQITGQEALNQSINNMASATGIATDKLKSIVNVRDLRQKQFAESATGKQLGFLAQFSGSKKFAESSVGKGLIGASRFASGEGDSLLSRGLGKIGGVAGLGASVSVGTSFISDQLKGFSDKLGLGLSNSTTFAGATGALQQGGATAATGAALGAQVAGPVGALIAGVGGAIIGGIEGYFAGANQQFITNTLKDIAESGSKLDYAFQQLDKQLNQSNITSAVQQFQNVVADTSKLDSLAFGQGGPTATDIGVGTGITATSALTGAGLGAAIGSVVPILGTAIGAAVGAGIGAVGGAAYSYFNAPSESARKEAFEARAGAATQNIESAQRLSVSQSELQSFDEIQKRLKDLEVGNIDASQTIAMYTQGLTDAEKEQAKETALIDAFVAQRKKQGADTATIDKEIREKREVALAAGERYIIQQEKLNDQQQLNAKATRVFAAAMEDLSARFTKVSAATKSLNNTFAIVEKELDIELAGLKGDITNNISTIYQKILDNLDNIENLSPEEYMQVAGQVVAGQGEAGQELLQTAAIGKVLDDQLKPLLRSIAQEGIEEGGEAEVSKRVRDLLQTAIPNIDPDTLDNALQRFEDKLQTGEFSLEQLAEEFGPLLGASKEAQQAIKELAVTSQNFAQIQANILKRQNELLVEGTNLRRQEAKAIRDSRLNYLRTTGQSIPLSEITSGFDEQIRIMTDRLVPGGSTDPNSIGAEIRARQEQNDNLRMINENLMQARNNRNASFVDREMARNREQIAANELAVRDGNEALNEIANNTDASSAALEKIREGQEKAQAARSLIQGIATGTTEDRLAIAQEVQAAQIGVGAIQAGVSSPFGDSRFLDRFLNSRALEVFGPKLAEQYRTQALIGYGVEQGLTGEDLNNFVRMMMSSIQGDQQSPEFKAYQQITERQINAINQMQSQNEMALNRVVDSLEKLVNEFRTGFTGLVPRASAAANTNQRAGSGRDPRRIAAGGVVYASEGTLVNYEPRGTDTVPAMLTPGEFVVNANATKKNRGLLEKINSGNTVYASRGGVIYAETGLAVPIDGRPAYWDDPEFYEARGRREYQQIQDELRSDFQRRVKSEPKKVNEEIVNKVLKNQELRPWEREYYADKGLGDTVRDARARRAEQARQDLAERNKPTEADQARQNFNSETLGDLLFQEMKQNAERDRYSVDIGIGRGLQRYYDGYFKDKMQSSFPLVGVYSDDSQMLYRWNPNATSPQGRKRNQEAIEFLENKIQMADEEALTKVDKKRNRKIKRDTKAKGDATERDNLLYQVYNAGHAWTDAQMVAKSKTLLDHPMSFRSFSSSSTAGSSINGHIVGLGDAPLVLTDVRGNGDRPELRPSAGQAQLSIRKTVPLPSPSMPGSLGDNQGFGGIIPVRLEQLDDNTLRATLKYFQEQTLEQEEANQERTDSARAASKAQSEENTRRAEELTYQRRHWGSDPEAWFNQHFDSIDLPGGRGSGLSSKKPLGPHKPLGSQKPLRSTIDHNVELKKQDMGRVNPMLGIDINQPIQAYDYGAPTIAPQDIEFNPSPSLPPLVPSLRDQADNIMRGGTTGLPGSGTENRGPNVAPIIAGGNTYQRLPDDILLTQGLSRELVDIYQQVYSDKDGYPISLRQTENSWQKGVDRFIHQPLETASKDLWESGNGLTSFFPAALNFAAGLALDSPTYSPGYVGEFENGTKLVIPSDSDVPLAVDLGLGIIANRIASISRLRAQARALNTANERALALGAEAPFYPPAIRPDATTPPIRPEITPQTTAESAGIFPDLFSPAPGSRITIGTNEINDVVFGPGTLQAIDPNTGSFSTQLRTPAQEFNPLPFESFPSNIDTVTAPRVIDSPGPTTTIDVLPSQATPRVAVTPPISGNVSIAPSPNSVRRSLTKRGLSPLVELDDDVARRIYQDFVEQGGVGSESAGKWLRSRIDSLNNAAIREGIGSGVKVVDLDPRPVTSPDIMNNQPVTPSERTGFYSNTTPTTPKPASVTVKPSVKGKPDISKPLMDYDSISTTRDKPTTPRRTELRPVETVVDADGRIIEVKPITEKDLSTSAGRSSLNSGESTITPKVNGPSLPAFANRQQAFEFLTEKMKLKSPFIGAEAGDWRFKPLAKTYDDFIKNIGGLDGLGGDKTALLKRLENADPNLIEIADLSFRKWSGGTIEKGRQGSMSKGFWDWTRGTSPQNIASYVQQYQQGSRGLVAQHYGGPFLKELEFIKKFNQIAPQGLYKGGIVYAQDGRYINITDDEIERLNRPPLIPTPVNERRILPGGTRKSMQDIREAFDPVEAFGIGAAKATGPTAAGIYAGGATTAFFAPAMGPFSLIPGLAVGVAAAGLTALTQDYALDKIAPEAKSYMDDKMRQNPIASNLGSAAPGVGTGLLQQGVKSFFGTIGQRSASGLTSSGLGAGIEYGYGERDPDVLTRNAFMNFGIGFAQPNVSPRPKTAAKAPRPKTAAKATRTLYHGSATGLDDATLRSFQAEGASSRMAEGHGQGQGFYTFTSRERAVQHANTLFNPDSTIVSNADARGKPMVLSFDEVLDPRRFDVDYELHAADVAKFLYDNYDKVAPQSSYITGRASFNDNFGVRTQMPDPATGRQKRASIYNTNDANVGQGAKMSTIMQELRQKDPKLVEAFMRDIFARENAAVKYVGEQNLIPSDVDILPTMEKANGAGDSKLARKMSMTPPPLPKSFVKPLPEYGPPKPTDADRWFNDMMMSIEKLPSPQEGMTRLFRIGDIPRDYVPPKTANWYGQQIPYDEWLKKMAIAKKKTVAQDTTPIGAAGKWFTDAPNELDFYIRRDSDKLDQLRSYHKDIPTSDLNKYNVANTQFKDSSANVDREFILPTADEAIRFKGPIGPSGYYKGGVVYANNGMLVPYEPRGTDTVPAMLTPGEFVVNRRATQENLPLLKSINNGTSYLQTGGPTGASSTNAGTGISFDITKFIDSVGSFHSSIGDFSVYVENFNKYVTKLEKLNIPSIPDKIEMVGTHRVDVTVTGAAAFEAIEEGVKSMINTKIGEKWSELWQQSGGQFGGPTR